MNFWTSLFEITKNSLTITCLVMLMLLLIEFVNVSSSGRLLERLRHKPLLQVIIATLLGLVPGCLGGFTIVSLYSHQLLGFGALVAGMISTFGDEAFIIFACSPKATLLLVGVLVIIAIVAGVITHYLFRKKDFHTSSSHTLEIHQEHQEHAHHKIHLAWDNIKDLPFSRAILLFSLVIYLTAIFTGTFSHEHGSMPNFEQYATTNTHEEAEHHHCHEHGAHTEQIADSEEHFIPYYHSDRAIDQHHHNHSIFSWENIVFILIAIFTLVIVAFSPEHFLQEHLWEHVIKKHFISILLWTFGTLLLLHLLYTFVDVNALLTQHRWTTLLLLFLAIIIGIIPESGPHLIFVVMYFSGTLPFSILLASSIVQDGHGALPLLAYSRRNFLLMKAINMFFALVVGLCGYFIGF